MQKNTHLGYYIYRGHVYVWTCNAGQKSGRKEGIEATKLENARKLLTMKVLTHEQISEAVGLPLEKIEELALEINIEK